MDYSPGKVTVSFFGNILTGYAKGTFIKATRNSDSVDLEVGAGGDACRVLKQDRSGTVTLTLLQSAASNDVLSALLAIDESTGLGKGELQIVDLLGTTRVHAASAWIKKPSDVQYGDSAESREWVFETNALEETVGSNPL